MHKLVGSCAGKTKYACLEKTCKMVGKADGLLAAEPFHPSLRLPKSVYLLQLIGHLSVKSWLMYPLDIRPEWSVAVVKQPRTLRSSLTWEATIVPSLLPLGGKMGVWEHVNMESWCTLNHASLLFMNPHPHSRGSADNFHLCTFLSLFLSAAVWVEMCHACMAHWKFRCFLSKTEMQCWPLSQKERVSL